MDSLNLLPPAPNKHHLLEGKNMSKCLCKTGKKYITQWFRPENRDGNDAYEEI